MARVPEIKTATTNVECDVESQRMARMLECESEQGHLDTEPDSSQSATVVSFASSPLSCSRSSFTTLDQV